MMRFHVYNGADMNYHPTPYRSGGTTALEGVVIEGCIETTTFLLDAGANVYHTAY